MYPTDPMLLIIVSVEVELTLMHCLRAEFVLFPFEMCTGCSITFLLGKIYGIVN